MNWRSALYVGSVVHRRLRPRRHRMRYRVFWLLLDVDEIPALARRLRLFAHNRAGIMALYDRDYGDRSGAPLRGQVERHLAAAGLDMGGGAIRLLTMPRVFGYVFNPISVYFCHRRDGALAAILYEVTNTFGDRHSYLAAVENDSGTIRQSCAKRLHVSPLMDMDMRYDFRVRAPAEDVRLAIAVRDAHGAPVMSAALSAARVPLSDGALARVLATHPLLTFKVIAAIHWEALLIWLKGVPFHHRPPPPPQPVTVARQRNP